MYIFLPLVLCIDYGQVLYDFCFQKCKGSLLAPLMAVFVTLIFVLIVALSSMRYFVRGKKGVLQFTYIYAIMI